MRHGGGAGEHAGVTIVGGVAELSEADWQREIDINLSGAYRVSKAFWPHFAEAGGGAILSTASIAGVVGVRQDAAYVASKAGLIMLSRCMALDGAPVGIRANCICPGFVQTPMFAITSPSSPTPRPRSPAARAAHPWAASARRATSPTVSSTSLPMTRGGSPARHSSSTAASLSACRSDGRPS